MKYPSRTILGLTWIGWLNFMIFQWLGIRLQGVVRSRDDMTISKLQIRWGHLPLTGWWSGYWPRGDREITLWPK